MTVIKLNSLSVIILFECLLFGGCQPKGAPPAKPVLTLAEKGKALISAKGCVACHTSDGTRSVGPSYKGIFGKSEKMSDGKMILVDESYIRESIESPQAKIVAGYPPSMPTYKGLISEDEMTAIIEYIKSLK